MKRVLFMLVAGAVLSGVAAAYASVPKQAQNVQPGREAGR